MCASRRSGGSTEQKKKLSLLFRCSADRLECRRSTRFLKRGEGASSLFSHFQNPLPGRREEDRGVQNRPPPPLAPVNVPASCSRWEVGRTRHVRSSTDSTPKRQQGVLGNAARTFKEKNICASRGRKTAEFFFSANAHALNKEFGRTPTSREQNKHTLTLHSFEHTSVCASVSPFSIFRWNCARVSKLPPFFLGRGLRWGKSGTDGWGRGRPFNYASELAALRVAVVEGALRNCARPSSTYSAAASLLFFFAAYTRSVCSTAVRKGKLRGEMRGEKKRSGSLLPVQWGESSVGGCGGPVSNGRRGDPFCDKGEVNCSSRYNM